MKCPKCGYLGFETTERCRHCGYDFSLSVPVETASELPLRPAVEPEAPFADFDLDRIIGAPEPDVAHDLMTATSQRDQPAVAVTAPGDAVRAQFQTKTASTPPAGLPLFHRTGAAQEDALVAPPPARPPLAVRRATPEVARRRTPRVVRRESSEPELELAPVQKAERSESLDTFVSESPELLPASAVRRVGAALVDILVLGSIDLIVLYLTLALAELRLADARVIPPIPMLAFLLLINGGYLIAFTAANGQTIGKMLTGVRVTSEDGGRVDVAGAFLRAAGVLLSIAILGLPYVPALVSSDKRALHDRLAGTRVIKRA
jgi:uncharacterized RDD family membrane protein YckC